MISEKKFIKNYTGFWNSLFPLQKAFLKGVVMECSQNQNDIKVNTTGRRFSFVSEIGFQLFAKAENQRKKVISIAYKSELYNNIESACIHKFELFNDDDSTICDSLTQAEFDDALCISLALESEFRGHNMVLSPEFIGCSIIDTCYGDVLVGDTLYEIKSVNRNFNVLDFRQLITYCALNHITKSNTINSIGLYNPKKGMKYTIPLNLFATAIAGIEINNLYWEVINFISQDETSK